MKDMIGEQAVSGIRMLLEQFLGGQQLERVVEKLGTRFIDRLSEATYNHETSEFRVKFVDKMSTSSVEVKNENIEEVVIEADSEASEAVNVSLEQVNAA